MTDDRRPHAPPPVLSIRGATVVADDGTPLLSDLTLRVGAGEHTAILGPNGAGKSSLIRLITHELRPLARADGEPVAVFGRDRWNVFELRAMLGIVTAGMHQLYAGGGPPVTALVAAVSGFFASREPFLHHQVTERQWERARAALEQMEIAHLADRPLTRMSTGEVRRVLIARALAPDPRALLLDEPTTGLDLVSRQRFLETLRGVARAGKTLVLVTHHVGEVLPEVERVALLRAGRVYRAGPKHEVLTGEHLSAVYGAPVRVEQRRGGYFAAAAASAAG